MKTRYMKCGPHGKSKWLLTVMCMACKRVYQAHLEGTEFKPIIPEAKPAPQVCECGAQLAALGPPPADQGTAIAICTECFKDRALAAASGAMQ